MATERDSSLQKWGVVMNNQLEKWNILLKRQDAFYHQCAKKSGLADAQFWVLYALCEAEQALCQNTFCENWRYSKQTVSAAVASLEKAGLVYLTYAEGSRKQKDIHLTEEGEAFCNKNIRTLQAVEEKVLMSLSDTERNTFFHLLGYLLDGLEKEWP